MSSFIINPYKSLTDLVVATGGDLIYDSGNDRVHVFSTTGISQFDVTFVDPSVTSMRVFVLGGGGGGGGYAYAGGGGAGKPEYNALFPINVRTYGTNVGAGGLGGVNVNPSTQYNGDNSVFTDPVDGINTITSLGGGYGGGFNQSGANGGNGGGAGYGGSPGTGTYNGGTSALSGSDAMGGGGAGAGANGGNANAGTSTAGDGGIGIQNSITGSNVWYAGGGGGGTYVNAPYVQGVGGQGGGGNAGQAGEDGKGAGGGGCLFYNAAHPNTGLGGKGGDGVIIIRYKVRN